MKNKEPRILLYDIETMSDIAYVWEKYDTNVVAYKKQGYMLCYAYKWLGEKKTHIVALPDFKGYSKDKSNDKELVTSLHKLFCEADMVVAHNGNSFDQKVAQARMIVNGLPPPDPYKQIDTKLIAKKNFRFNSNSLNDLGKYLGVGQKVETGGFGLWIGCENGDKESWRLMKKYNIQDVLLLEQVYLKLRPWMDNHPNRNLITGESSCPICGSPKIHKRGFSYTRTKISQRFQCQLCHGWSLGSSVSHPQETVVR